MSETQDSFSAEWLALREPVDHAARDVALARRAASLLAQRDVARVIDLGCGAGSNLRGFAPFLGARQHWSLVDHDPKLLDAARAELTAWADRVDAQGDALILEKGDKRIEVRFVEADLAADPARVLSQEADLVTAAALFDLVSDAWLERFADALAARRLPLYTVLIYDGVERWEPPHEADADALAAFHAHQKTDKSFGPALGPDAAPVFASKLAARGYSVDTALSPWRLGREQADLIRDLASGAAKAIAETGRVAPQRMDAWRRARVAARSAEIGHVDLLAVAR